MPWYRQGFEYPFANSNFHPDFPTSGANIIAAWEALGFNDVDGVLTADMVAVSNILEEVGPVESGDYGRVTSGNVIHKVLVEAYREYSPARRQAMNSQLRTDLLEVVSRPAGALATLTGVWRSIPGRHVQAFLADDRMQQAVELAGASGALQKTPATSSGSSCRAGSASWPPSSRGASRTLLRSIRMVLLTSRRRRRSPMPYPTRCRAGQIPEGATLHSSSGSEPLTACRMSADSASVRVTSGKALVAPSETGPFPDQSGGQVLWQGQDIPPGETRSTVMEYRLPPGTFDRGGALRYSMTANPQSVVQPVELTVTVRFEGATPRPPGDSQWMVTGDTASWSGKLDRTVELAVDATVTAVARLRGGPRH